MHTATWSEEVFVIKKVKNIVPWTYVINHLDGEEILGMFYESELQKTNQKEFRMGKVIKRKGAKLYVKWKRYNERHSKFFKSKCKLYSCLNVKELLTQNRHEI